MSAETVCGAILGATILATFTWPEVVVATVVGFAMFLVVGCIACVVWERVWTARNGERPVDKRWET